MANGKESYIEVIISRWRFEAGVKSAPSRQDSLLRSIGRRGNIQLCMRSPYGDSVLIQTIETDLYK